MWLKLFFLLLYLVLLFLLARVFEAVLWYETGVFATQLVDPVTLSYNKLKTILESRGLGYSGLAEKKEVSKLVQESGKLTEGELYSAIKKVTEQSGVESSSTHFSGEMHFYELVEDTKDGIWLIQVVAREREALLSHSNWVKMVQKVSQFGIRTGTFNCTKDYRSCAKRGWQRSSIIMSVPQTSASKGKVMMREYDGRRIEIEHIFRWMTSHVAHRIKTVRGSKQLMEEWRSDSSQSVKMFLFAHLSQPPAFFSSLSVKFTGRIEFIFVDVRHWDDHSILPEIGVTKSPAYILKMPEGIYRYGNSPGEFLSLAAMDTFLRSVQPEVNDVFVLSLVLINLLAWMDLFITQGATVKRFVVLIRTLGTYNSLLLVSWLPVLALLQLPYLDWLSGYSLKLLRYADTTALASLLRADWTFYSSHPALFLSTYLAHGLLVDYFEKRRRCGDRTQDDSTSNLEWLASLWDWYTSYLLHPIASLHHFPLDHSDWEDDPNLLLERLAFPDLWLRPLVNMDYIKELPTWRLRALDHRKGEDVEIESHAGAEGKDGASAVRGSTSPSCSLAASCQRSVCSNQLTAQSSQLTASSSQLTASSSQSCICSSQLTASGSKPTASSSQLTASSSQLTASSSQITVSGSQSCVCSSQLTASGSVCAAAAPSPCGCCGMKGSTAAEDLVEDGLQEDGGVVSAAWWPKDTLQCSECVVCLENFLEEDVLMALPCGHAFHQQCIVVWLAAGRHCCPVCRWPSYKKKQLTASPTPQ